MNMRFDGEVKTFEEVYPKAPFSELIRLSLLAAAALRGIREQREKARDLPQAQRASAVS
jgi:hypothetical protein